MGKNIFYILLLMFLGNFRIDAYAQSLWINAVPSYYHGSFVGSSGTPTVAINTSMQNSNWFKSTPYYFNQLVVQNVLAGDHFVKKIRTGIGAYIKYDLTTNDLFHSYSLKYLEGGISIAPKFSFKGKYTLSPSLQLLGGNHIHDFSYPTNDPFNNWNKARIEMNLLALKSGIMFNSKKFFIGLNYIISSNYFIQNNDLRLYNNIKWETYDHPKPLTFIERISVIGGYTFRKSDDSKFSFTPVILLGNQTLNNTYVGSSRHKNNLY